MIFPDFAAGEHAVTKWYHFAFAADGRRTTQMLEAVAGCMQDYSLQPLQRFLGEYGTARRRQRELARQAVPRSTYEETAKQLGDLEWEGHCGTHLQRRLEIMAVPAGDEVLLPRGRLERLRSRLHRLDRLEELGAPPEMLHNEWVMIAQCVEGERPIGDGDRGGNMESFPLAFASALEICCPLDPENLGLADRYGLLLDVDRLFGDPWTSELRLPRPLVPPDLPRDVGFVERFGHHPQAGDEMGPVTVGRGSELVALSDRLLAEPPDARGCKGRITRYARACRRIGRQDGTMLSFVGKDPAL